MSAPKQTTGTTGDSSFEITSSSSPMSTTVSWTNNTTSQDVETASEDLARKRVRCASCGEEVFAGDVCSSCGEEMSVEIEINIGEEDTEDAESECPECGAMVPAGAETCPECGASMMGDPEESDVEASSLPTWESELAYEGLPTSDGRYLMPGAITHRDLPLTLMCQTKTAEGHMGADACGKITRIWREDRPDLGEGVVAVMGAGEFSTSTEMGAQAAALVEEQVLRGVSIDLAPSRRVLVDRETGDEVDESSLDFEKALNGDYLLGVEGEIMGATLVPFPAFAESSMRIVSRDDAIVASAGVDLRLIPVAITAAAAKMAPLKPPKEWFFQEEPEGKFPLTVMDDGRVLGHLATWDQCHQGFMNDCVLAKPSRSDYSLFHVGAIRTAEGETVNVGRIVVGDAGHAPLDYSVGDTSRFYDKTGCVGAFVRAVDGKYGIWLSGVVRSDCPAEKVRDMMANPPSGDWRRDNGWLELIAALSVPVPGFPVPRYEYALAASADAVEVSTLVATGYYEVEKPTLSRAQLRRKELLLKEARGE